jgi:hypothetical protein
MTGRTENGEPFSLAVALATDQHTGGSLTATPPSTQEHTMYPNPEQLARNHLDNRLREVELWRLRRVARAVRRAEAAERRARLAREAAVLAVRESAVLAMN